MNGERLRIVGAALAVGCTWLAVELGFILADDRAVHVLDALRGFAGALPWQLGVFALLGAATLPVARLGWRRASLVTLALATLLFVGARQAEGLVRREQADAVDALVRLGGLVAACAVASGLLVLAGGVLPGALRRRWPMAVWLAWGLLLVPVLHRSAALLALGALPPWSEFFSPWEVGFALLAAAAVLLTAPWPRSWPALAALLLLPLLASAGRNPESALRAGGEAKPDVVMIVIDTMRADHLGMEVGGRSLTPNVDAVVAQSVEFARAYAPGNQTLLAMPGVLSSLSAFSVGRRLSPAVKTLPEHLLEAGYATLGISANPFISARLGYDQGFQWFSDPDDWPVFMVSDVRRLLGMALPGVAYHTRVASSSFYYRPVSEIRRRAVSLLGRAPRPTFLYLHTMDMHGPYLPPHEHLSEAYRPEDFLSYFLFLRLAESRSLAATDRAGELANLRERYAAELRFTDAELGALFDSLRESGRFDESLIWILADHGESFGEQGFAGHGGANNTPSVAAVPLILKPPRSWGLAPRRVETPVSTSDVLPTTLGLLGLPQAEPRLGTDLTPLLSGGTVERDVPVVCQATAGGVRILSAFEGPWKFDFRYALSSGWALDTALFDLRSDPEQQRDHRFAMPGVAARMQKDVEEYLAAERRVYFDTQAELDPLTRERLLRLGYVE